MKSRYFYQLAALSAVWGATYLLVRISTPDLGPSVGAAMRIGFGAATLYAIMRINGVQWPTAHWRFLALLSVTAIALPHLLHTRSSLYLPAGYSAVISVSSVLFGAIASAWLGEDKLTPSKIIGCLAAFAGIALLVRLGPVKPDALLLFGTVLGLASSLLSGSSAPFLKRATRQMEPLAVTAAIHLAGFIVLLPFALWDLPQARFTPRAVGAVAIMGIATSGLAYWLYMRIVKHVSPVAAQSSTFMVTLFGVWWGHLFLGEVLTPASYAGAALVLVASMLVTGFRPWQRAPKDAAATPSTRTTPPPD